ncbi:MAG: peptide deformylase [Methylococcaceae bacterium]
MSILTILEFPDERLRKIAKPIKDIDNNLQTLIDDMLETMYYTGGIGLAATQVNVHVRLLVIDTSEEKNAPLCLINPEIISKDGEFEYKEGCLSVPESYEKIIRPGHITVKGLDRNGKEIEIEANDLLSTCIQHEIDHLNGKLFIDYLSQLKRQRIKTKIEKMHRLEGKS